MTIPLTRTAASGAVGTIGWRYLLGTLVSSVAVGSLGQAALVASAAVASCGPDAEGHLRADLRPDRVELTLQTVELDAVTARDAELAHGITDAVRDLGLDTGGATSRHLARPLQQLEIAIDALDIPAVRPFWKAVMGYADEVGDAGPCAALVDPARLGPAIWFQQLDRPRPQRNRIHLDLTVAHDEADARVAAALAAGGRLVSAARARAFWILADAEGNEVCVCTWQDRD